MAATTSRWARRLTIAGICLALGLAGLATRAVILSVRYDVPLLTATRGAVRDAALESIRLMVAVYDPSDPRTPRLAPDEAWAGAGLARLDADTSVEPWTVGGRQLTVGTITVDNARVQPARYPFRYQPYDEPRLHELRERYALDDLLATAPTEFEGMVRLRHWARSQFQRHHYQPLMVDFDALTVLARGYRRDGLEYDLSKVYDPCHFFPLFLSQLLVSVGHQARLVSVEHGMMEVWSNQYAKWVLFDAELDLHYERNGVPLNMLDMARTDEADAGTIRVVRSPREPGQENPTMAHLGFEDLAPDRALAWFKVSLEITELRNDWMTNHYFRGHPARSEANTLVLVRDRAAVPAERWYVQRLRPSTDTPDDAYWTLNQAEIFAASGTSGVLPLAFRTITPNFAHFELVIDDTEQPPLETGRFDWRLHAGGNRLEVRPVNRFGVPGVASTVEIHVDEPVVGGRDEGEAGPGV